MAEPEAVEDIEFIWGKKRGLGGKKKDVQFYESFTYDGVDYTLYDSVYLYKEGEAEPYIGKLIKIWENPDKSKKVKILWFFRPCEILNFLGSEDIPNNELFMASGDGIGLANVNPLEVIAGKCNVVCISKDGRNLQPSDEELHGADFVFYRTFDVGIQKICEKIGQKVAGLEAKLLLNRDDPCKPKDILRHDLHMKEIIRTHNNGIDSEKVSGSAKARQNSSEGNIIPRVDKNVVTRSPNETDDSKATLPFVLVSKVDIEEKVNSSKASGDLDQRPSKKARRDSSAQFAADNSKNCMLKSKLEPDISDAKVIVPNGNVSEDFSKLGVAKNSHGEDKGAVKKLRIDENITKLSNGKMAKTPSMNCLDKDNKLDSSAPISVDNKKNTKQKLSLNLNINHTNAFLPNGTVAEDTSEFRVVKDSHGEDKSAVLKLKPEKLIKLSNENMDTNSPRNSSYRDNNVENQEVEVARRPDAERSRWFRGLPWEERVKTAHEQGTLVLLQNLDPAYTSAEVEDLVSHAFKESCTAKMIQRTAFSSPHSGQAYVIFKTREAAEKAVGKLDEGCLLLSNGRPLVGSIAAPYFPAKKPTYSGHLVIDKLRLQMQREMKDAVSTSHCSQPNTVEYEMAMEWCLLQERSERARDKLYKQQGEELKKLKAQVKSR